MYSRGSPRTDSTNHSIIYGATVSNTESTKNRPFEPHPSTEGHPFKAEDPFQTWRLAVLWTNPSLGEPCLGYHLRNAFGTTTIIAYTRSPTRLFFTLYAVQVTLMFCCFLVHLPGAGGAFLGLVVASYLAFLAYFRAQWPSSIRFSFDKRKAVLELHIRDEKSENSRSMSMHLRHVQCFRVRATTGRSGGLAYGVELVPGWHANWDFMDKVHGTAEQASRLVHMLNETLAKTRANYEEEQRNAGEGILRWTWRKGTTTFNRSSRATSNYTASNFTRKTLRNGGDKYLLRGNTLRLQLLDEIVVVTSLPRATVIVNIVIKGLFAIGFVPSIRATLNLAGYLDGEALLILSALTVIPAVIALGILPSFGWTNCIAFAGQTGRREGSNKLLEATWRDGTKTLDAEDIMQFRVGRAKGWLRLYGLEVETPQGVRTDFMERVVGREDEMEFVVRYLNEKLRELIARRRDDGEASSGAAPHILCDQGTVADSAILDGD